jgi:hypothetical protein
MNVVDGAVPHRVPRVPGVAAGTLVCSIANYARIALTIAIFAGALMAVLLWPAPARAGGLDLPPAVGRGLDLLYNGQPEKALAEFRGLEAERPDDPLGYILEADARWWQIYCQACEIKWNMLDAWPQPPRVPADQAYFAVTDKIVALAQAQIAKNDSATMELYAGMGWLLRARLLALRDERLASARAGVKARTHLLHCLQLDPQMADANLGLGIYNYYVDTLSGMAKALRFLMGIPGGDKHEGVRQLRVAIDQGALTQVEASFYLAKNLRIYEHDFTGAVDTMQRLATKYPGNPVFRLLLGDFQRELHQTEQARANFRAAEQLQVTDAGCAKRIHELAEQAAALLPPNAVKTAP